MIIAYFKTVVTENYLESKSWWNSCYLNMTDCWAKVSTLYSLRIEWVQKNKEHFIFMLFRLFLLHFFGAYSQLCWMHYHESHCDKTLHSNYSSILTVCFKTKMQRSKSLVIPISEVSRILFWGEIPVAISLCHRVERSWYNG